MTRRFAQGTDRGAAAVELAVVMPLLIFLVMGLVDVGRYTYYGIVAAHAARAAVQYGGQTVATAADDAGMKTAAASDSSSLSGLTVTPAISCYESGSPTTCPRSNTSVPSTFVYYVSVTVTGTFNTLVNYPGIPTAVPVTASATMRVASQ